MKNIFSIFILFSIAIIIGCSSSPSEKESGEDQQAQYDSLFDQVMAVHDEVMPKMEEIHDLKKRIEKELEIVEGDSEMVLKTAHKELSEADKGMRDWMRNFRKPADDLSMEEKMNYLRQEKETISKVSEDMLSSIENANNALRSLSEE